MAVTNTPYAEDVMAKWQCDKCKSIGSGPVCHCEACKFDLCVTCAGPSREQKHSINRKSMSGTREVYIIKDNRYTVSEMTNCLAQLLKCDVYTTATKFATTIFNEGSCLVFTGALEQCRELTSRCVLSCEIHMITTSTSSETTLYDRTTSYNFLLSFQRVLFSSAVVPAMVKPTILHVAQSYVTSLAAHVQELLVQANAALGEQRGAETHVLSQILLASPLGKLLPELSVVFAVPIMAGKGSPFSRMPSVNASLSVILALLTKFHRHFKNIDAWDVLDLDHTVDEGERLLDCPAIMSKMVESAHPFSGAPCAPIHVSIFSATFLRIVFDPLSALPESHDTCLEVMSADGNVLLGRYNGKADRWREIIIPNCNAVSFVFRPDPSAPEKPPRATSHTWGWRAHVTGYACGPNGLSLAACGTTILESSHPYTNNACDIVPVDIKGASLLVFKFDPRCQTEMYHDFFQISGGEGKNAGPSGMCKVSGPPECWPLFWSTPAYPDTTMTFTSDPSGVDWGYRVQVTGYSFSGVAKDPTPSPVLVDLCQTLALLVCSNSIVEISGASPEDIQVMNTLEKYAPIFSGGLAAHRPTLALPPLIQALRAGDPLDSRLEFFLGDMQGWGRSKNIVVGAINDSHESFPAIMGLMAVLIMYHGLSDVLAVMAVAKTPLDQVPKGITEIWRTAFSAQKLLFLRQKTVSKAYADAKNRVQFLLVTLAVPGMTDADISSVPPSNVNWKKVSDKIMMPPPSLPGHASSYSGHASTRSRSGSFTDRDPPPALSRFLDRSISMGESARTVERGTSERDIARVASFDQVRFNYACFCL